MISPYINKIALITGASSGIGAEFARQFHALGARVILVARREDRLQAIAAELNAVRPKSTQVIVADLLGAGLSDLERFLLNEPVDILICNAGKGSFGRFENLNLDQEEELVRLNLVVPLRLMHAVIPQMKKARSGDIISVASIAAFQPLPYMSTYSATKAFNLNHALGLRHELAEFGIKVITLCPGPTATEYHSAAGIPEQWSASYHDSAREVVSGAIAALDRNQAWVTPGIRSRTLAFFARLLPLDFTTWISRRVLSGALKCLEDAKK
jgi:short-subunit dehydrogenase